MDRMKKRLFLMLGVLAVSVVMQAQPKAGTISVIPRVGINFANLTNNEVVVDLANQSKTLKSRIKPGLTISTLALFRVAMPESTTEEPSVWTARPL